MRLIVGGAYCARLSWLGKSREYIQKIPPTVSAAKKIPSVIAVKMAPKKDPMNLITRAFPDDEANTPRLYTRAGGKVKTKA